MNLSKDAKELDQNKLDKFENVLKVSKIDDEIKDKKSKLSKEEKIELKAYAIKKALKIKKYVRN